ncbi:MAG: GNAT family N-acetyltransferase [Anaerolineales bacterium]
MKTHTDGHARETGGAGRQGAVLIRPAVESDARRIRAMVRRERLNPIGLAWPRFLVAVDEAGHVIGCGQIKPVGGGARELASLVVDPEWRDRRVGASLMRRLMTDAGPPLWLMCRSGLKGYYEKFGFRVVAADAAQPGHFKRMRRLVTAVRMTIGLREDLTVMVWEAPPP